MSLCYLRIRDKTIYFRSYCTLTGKMEFLRLTDRELYFGGGAASGGLEGVVLGSGYCYFLKLCILSRGGNYMSVSFKTMPMAVCLSAGFIVRNGLNLRRSFLC
jgi:hypothetical protein